MKKLNLFIVFFISLNFMHSQTFINGSFEINSVTDCDYNNSNVTFNSKVPNVYSFGAGDLSDPFGFQGEVDIQTNNCYVTPQNGNWCLGITASSNFVNDADAIALELTSNLIIGQTYQLSFYVYGNSTFVPATGISTIKVGISNSNTDFGSLIYTATTEENIWKNITFTFEASQNSNYITLSYSPGIPSWTQIDNFTLTNSLNVNDYESNKFNIYPNPFSDFVNIQFNKYLENSTLIVYNWLGQEVKQIKNFKGNDIILYRDNLSEGLYLVQIKQNNQVIFADKILISN